MPFHEKKQNKKNQLLYLPDITALGQESDEEKGH